MKYRILLPAVVCALLTAMPVPASKRLRPTSDALRHQLNQVAVATATEQLAPNRIRFKKERMIQGESDGPWDIRMKPQTAAKVKIGSSYIVAFSGYVFKEHQPAPWIDPKGMRLLGDGFVGGEVLLPVLPELEKLLAMTPEERKEKPQELINTALEAMRKYDAQICRIAVGELSLRPEVLEQADRRSRAIFITFITTKEKDAQARATLLEAGLRMEPGENARWTMIAARLVTKSATLQPAPASFEGRLQRTALQVLNRHGSIEDAPDIARMLTSSSTGVAVTALKVLEQMDVHLAVREVKKALEKEDLAPQSRQDFEVFLRRALLHPAAKEALQGPANAPAPSPAPAPATGTGTTDRK